MTRAELAVASLQDTAPVQTEDENGKASTEKGKTDPIEVQEQILGQLLTMQHAESGWVYWRGHCQHAVRRSNILEILTVEEVPR
jgi:hypothetical protein